MNAVEIEAAVSELACLPFNASEFPFEFLVGFGNKEITVAKLRKGSQTHLTSQMVSFSVTTYTLSLLRKGQSVTPSRLSEIVHRVFSSAQLDLTLEDRFGNPVRPKEWFLVPLHVIDEVIERIRDGSIANVVYSPAEAKLLPVSME